MECLLATERGDKNHNLIMLDYGHVNVAMLSSRPRQKVFGTVARQSCEKRDAVICSGKKTRAFSLCIGCYFSFISFNFMKGLATKFDVLKCMENDTPNDNPTLINDTPLFDSLQLRILGPSASAPL